MQPVRDHLDHMLDGFLVVETGYANEDVCPLYFFDPL
jgi:hypothetical protein